MMTRDPAVTVPVPADVMALLVALADTPMVLPCEAGECPFCAGRQGEHDDICLLVRASALLIKYAWWPDARQMARAAYIQQLHVEARVLELEAERDSLLRELELADAALLRQEWQTWGPWVRQ